MARVLLGVTGSVAAIKTPELYKLLRQEGHDVKVLATRAALYFFDPNAIDGLPGGRNPDRLILDQDEWPGLADGQRWQREEPVLHIELRRWAEILVVAPLDANTLAKFAAGLADNCLSCVWRAWDPGRPILLAPAMNTLMWDHPLTRRHLRALVEDAPNNLTCEETLGWINAHSPQMQIVGPISKRLACGDVGVGAMAPVTEIAAQVTLCLRQTAPPQ